MSNNVISILSIIISAMAIVISYNTIQTSRAQMKRTCFKHLDKFGPERSIDSCRDYIEDWKKSK